jgi:hypothetical protein
VANPGQPTIGLSTGDAVKQDLSVMFSPHAPAAIVRVVDDRLEVLVPEGSRTGPVAVVKKTPDFTSVKGLLAELKGVRVWALDPRPRG